MNWIQIKAQVTPENAEALEESLMAAGASAVTMQDAADQPILEPELGTTPLWQATVVTGLFSADEDMEQVKNIANKVFQNLSSDDMPELKIEILENEDWTRKWIENFKPIHFGKRLWICPSWCEVPDKSAVNLLLDPGLAFGTGTHPTTALCLQWLDELDLKGKTVVDFGCGSGILGIAALLLGAEHVIAIDNDPQALTATKDNAARNSIDPSKLDMYLPEEVPETKADIVIANILAKPLHELKNHIAALVTPGGTIALSGILEHQAKDLTALYAQDFTMEPAKNVDGWIRLSGKKK